jgi:hypothetical protein
MSLQAVQFKIDTDLSKLAACDCSPRIRKKALMVKGHESTMRILSGNDSLTAYQFHTHTAEKKCGFHGTTYALLRLRINTAYAPGDTDT